LREHPEGDPHLEEKIASAIGKKTLEEQIQALKMLIPKSAEEREAEVLRSMDVEKVRERASTLPIPKEMITDAMVFSDNPREDLIDQISKCYTVTEPAQVTDGPVCESSQDVRVLKEGAQVYVHEEHEEHEDLSTRTKRRRGRIGPKEWITLIRYNEQGEVEKRFAETVWKFRQESHSEPVSQSGGIALNAIQCCEDFQTNHPVEAAIGKFVFREVLNVVEREALGKAEEEVRRRL